MKKSFLVIIGMAVLATGAYFSTRLLAQAPATGGASATTPQVPTGTRVAMVNIGYVFNKYGRATQFKTELEETIKPFKEKAKVLTDQMKSWHDEMQKPNFDQKKKEQYDAGILNNKRQLEDMQRDIQKLIGKKQEDNLVTLWKEVNTGIEAVAKAYGFQIVFGYGDPMEKELMHLFPNINRKMQAMDLGSTVPLYVHDSVDLSRVITDTLNSWHQKSLEKQPVTPAGGTSR